MFSFCKLFFHCLVIPLAFAMLLTACHNNRQPPRYKVGFKLLMAVAENAEESVEFILWYPGKKTESDVSLGAWTLQGGRNASPANGKFPLLIISHDTGANKFSYHDTARQLAAAGFAVAAPTHKGDNDRDMSKAYTAEQIFGRTGEISLLVDFLSRNEYKDFIDTSRIGILGAGSGAAAALILAGGNIDISGYSEYCANLGENDSLCSPWVKQRLTTLSFYLPQSPKSKLAGVKALALAAPDYGALFTRHSLAEIKARIYVFDTGLEADKQAARIRDILPGTPRYLLLPGLDSRDLTAPCGDSVLGETTWQCDPVPDDSLEVRDELFNNNLIHFFSKEMN